MPGAAPDSHFRRKPALGKITYAEPQIPSPQGLLPIGDYLDLTPSWSILTPSSLRPPNSEEIHCPAGRFGLKKV